MQEQPDIHTTPAAAPTDTVTTTTTLTTLDERLDEYDRRIGQLEAWAGALYHHERDAGFYLTPVPPAFGGALPLIPAPPAPPPFAASWATIPQPLPSTAGAAPSPRFSGSAPVVAPVAPIPTRPAFALLPPGPETRRAPSWRTVEQFIGERGLAWAGGLALLLGAVFFLGLVVTRGWLGPTARVGIGLVGGVALFAAGVVFFARRERAFGHVLVAVGTGVTATALFAATRLYDLLPLAAGLGGVVLIAVAAAIVAVRANAPVVAAYGLAGALLAPVFLGASVTPVTVAFLAALLLGTTGVALYRTWAWLPALAFLFAALQIGGWLINHAALIPGLATLIGFWLLTVVAMGGDTVRVRRNALQPVTAVLALAHAAFHVACGLALLDRVHTADARGAYVLLTAVAYGAVGAYFLRTRGTRHPFGALMMGTAVAALTLAAPVQFHGAVVPVAWAAEGAALAWLYGRDGRRGAGIGALVLGALTGLHLITGEYPFWHLLIDTDRTIRGVRPVGVPFANGNGATLACLLLALAVAALVVRQRAVRAGLVAAGFALIAYALPFEIAAVAVQVAGWCALAVLLIGVERRDAAGKTVYRLTAGLLIATAACVTVISVAVPGRLAVHAGRIIAHPPFISDATLALGALVVALIVVARTHRRERGAAWFAVGASVTAVYLLSVGTVDLFAAQTGGGADIAAAAKGAQVALSALWATIGGGAFVFGVFRRDRLTRTVGLALLAVVTAKVFLYDLAALDTAYRVLSLIALGVLLLASSYLYQRQARRADATGGAAVS